MSAATAAPAAIEIDLWQWRLEAPDAATLSPDELARAARFVFARDRDRYIAGRAMLRRILGRYLDRPARDLAFRYGAQGRPELDGIAFNLSHTQDLAALVVCRAPLRLGVDIEAVRPIEPGLAEAHFAPPEIAALHALPEAGRQDAFFRCWTRKEAYLKAMGTGLSTDLASFCVTLAAEAPRLLTCAPGDAADWVLLDVVPAPGVAGAVAIRSRGRAVSLRQCQP